MDWMEALNDAIDYMEEHLLEDISADQVARNVNMSSFYFQKGFKIMTGVTISEYIRNRRLSLAGQELASKDVLVIDVAYKYGYETPESFSKAFSRFHKISPVQAKSKSFELKVFKRLRVKIIVEGGNNMDYRIEHKDEFKLMGVKRTFTFDSAYGEIPKFWDDFYKTYDCEQMGELIPMYGLCVEGTDGKSFSYYIAGDYNEGKVPEGFETVEVPSFDWAVFPCVGPLPGALQSVNTRVFSEWLPKNKEYEIAAGMNIEMYTYGDTSAKDYLSEIWIPVKKK